MSTEWNGSAELRERFTDLTGKVCIITGASRGIGRECALSLARLGCRIVIAAKSVEPHPTLPGTIYTVAEEVERLGSQALPFQLDLRDAEDCQKCIDATVATFGRIDILINNASALWWKDIDETPLKKYNLITEINVGGSFAMTQAAIPYLKASGNGHVITMSPPIKPHGYAGRTAYNISKMGMTMVAMGVAEECRGVVSGNSLWPATVIESLASINFQLGEKEMWRKATILSDVVCSIVCKPQGEVTGQMLYDDKYLREFEGFETADFACYQMVPGVEPPLLLMQAEEMEPEQAEEMKKMAGDLDRKAFDRGNVNELTAEQKAQAAKDRESTDTVSRL